MVLGLTNLETASLDQNIKLARLTKDGTLFEASTALSALLGLNGPFHQNWQEFIHPEDRMRWKALVLRLAKSPQSDVSAEFRLNLKSGTRWFCHQLGLIHPESKAPYFLLMLHDVTDSKKLEQVCERAEAKFRRIFDSNLIGVAYADSTGVIYEVNDYYAELLGYTREEFKAARLRWSDYTPPEHLKCSQEGCRQVALTGSSAAFEKPYIRKDGTIVWVIIWLTTVEENSKSRVVAFVVDLTARKKAEAEYQLRLQSELEARRQLEEERKRLRNLFSQAPALVCILKGPDLIYELANEQYAKLIGDRNVIGKPVHQALPGFDSNALCTLKKVYLTGKAFSAQNYAISADWEGNGIPVRRYFNLTYEPIWDRDGGGVEGVWVLAQDMTESKQMEAKLHLSERLASLGTLAAGVGHEINTPLAYSLLNLELLSGEMAQLLNPAPAKRALQRLCKVQDGLERVRNIVKGLQTFSQSDHDDISAVDLHEILDSALDMAANEIKHRAELVKRYGAALKVRGDRTRLGQIFLNVLINAAQAIPDGHRGENQITVTTSAKNQKIAVEITDTGAGISPQDLKHIFDPFYTTKPVGFGTGLGLSICHGIAKSLGGEINVESELGKGTSVMVVLPGSEDTLPEPSLPIAEPAYQESQTARILMIEDDAQLTEVVCEALSPYFEVQAVGTGNGAIKILKSGQTFDVILCDLMLPDLNGIGVYREIEAHLPGLQERMIFVSGGSFTREADIFLKEVRNKRLFKPFRLHQLIDLIRSVVESQSSL